MPYFPARFPALCLVLLGCLSLFSGCGSSSNTNTVSSLELGTTASGSFVNITSTQSLQQGQVQVLATQAKNSKGTVIFPIVTWTSSNPSVASVSTSGEVCGGTWDANFINCTPGALGTATITATAGSQKATVTETVHARINKVTLTPTQSGCSSQTQTVQYTLHALDVNNNDITSQVGPPTYTATDTTVATVDTNGLATARNSGATTIVGSVGGSVSSPSVFVTCAPASIVLHKSGDPAGTTTTSFTLATSTSQALVADVTDTKGNPVAGLTLTLSSNQPAALTTSGTTITGTDVGIATAVASCTPPSCNPGNNLGQPGTGVPIYSNLVSATVTGTPASTTVYVTGAVAADGTTANTSLVPINNANGTPLPAITLPVAPTSMAISPRGDQLFVGGATTMSIISTATNAITSNVGSVGTIIGVSPSGTQVVTYDPGNSRVLLYDDAAKTVTTIAVNVTKAPQATFTPDGFKVFVAGDTHIYEFNAAAGLHRIDFSANQTSVTALPQGVAAYTTPFSSTQIASVGTCTNSVLTTPSMPGPNFLQATVDGTQIVGLNASSWMTLPYSVTSGACPPAIADNNGANTFAYGGPAPTNLYVSPALNFSFATAANATATTNLPFLNMQTQTSGSAPLSNGDTGIFTTGGFTLSGSAFYVGVTGGTAGNSVHLFDLTSGTPTDRATVTVSFRPDFVVVKP